MSRTLSFCLFCFCLLTLGCGGKEEEAGNSNGGEQNGGGEQDRGEFGGEKKLIGGMGNDTPSNNYVLLSHNRALQFKVVNNLKMVAVAMLNYNNQHGTLPAGGQGNLSWRVRLLPHLGQNNLYQQFRMNEPWNSTHNKKLISKMPDVYKTTSSDDHTTLMVFAGKGAMYDGAKPPTMGQITDGISNTILVMVGGADKAVPWTKPHDLRFNPADPYREVGEVGDTLIFATAGGAASRRTKSSTPANVLKAMITKNAGDVVQH